jgi:signal transduction histidine kinase
MQVFLIIGIVGTGIVVSILYSDENNSIELEYLISNRYAEESLINSVQLADKSFASYDNVFNRPLNNALVRFLDEYNQTGGDPSKLDLEDLRNELDYFFSEPIDLYIINDSGVIQYSTFSPDIGLNFSAYPSFVKKLNEIRLGNKITYDSIVTGTEKGEYRKYAYYPTPDHKYILEIGINLDNLFKRENISKYRSLAEKYRETTPDVISVWIFDRTATSASDIRTSIAGFEYYQSRLEDIPDRQKNIIDVFKEKKTMDVGSLSSPDFIRYVYIPGGNSRTVSSDLHDKVAEIIYDTSPLHKKQEGVFKFYLLVAIIVIFGLIIIAYFASRYISKPVYEIIEDIEVIANGDYDHKIRRTKGFEFRRLELSIQKLVEKLKEDIVSISQKSSALDNELKNRYYVEESLRAVNKKLSLLSGITRHDILNRVTIMNFYCEEVNSAITDPVLKSQIKKIYSSAKEIQTLISFTGQYQDLGAFDPAWHNLSLIVQKRTIQNLLGQIAIISTLEDLEIYADQMFEKVIYNLVENSVRHGKSITIIRLSCHQDSDDMIIWYEDDGGGIVCDEKEKVFNKGFGKNTGLGLFLIREILSITGITITEIGEFGVGVRFEIRVPSGKWKR